MENKWAKDQIIEIMADSQKTRYKALNPEQLFALENALLLVSKTKKNSYVLAMQGIKPPVVKISDAILLLHRNMIDNSDVSMFPN